MNPAVEQVVAIIDGQLRACEARMRVLHRFLNRPARQSRQAEAADARRFRRDLKATEARIAEVAENDADEYHRITSPQTVVRKALGEFDVDDAPDVPWHVTDTALAEASAQITYCSTCGGVLIRCCDKGRTCSNCGRPEGHAEV